MAQLRSKSATIAGIGAPALDRGLAVLEALDMRPEGMSLSEISRISSKEGWHRHHQRPKSEAG